MSRPSCPASTAFVAALVDALGLSAHGSMTELAALIGIDSPAEILADMKERGLA